MITTTDDERCGEFWPHMQVLLRFERQLKKLLKKHTHAQIHAGDMLSEYWIKTSNWDCVIHYESLLGLWQGYYFGLSFHSVPAAERTFEISPRKLGGSLDRMLAAVHPDVVTAHLKQAAKPKAKPAAKKKSKARR